MEAGAARHQVDRALAEKWLVAVRRGVFRLEGTQPSRPQDVMAATLAAGVGAVASHRAAGTLLGFPGLARRTEVTLPMSRTTTVKGLVVHRTRLLSPEDWTMRGPIPITSPARTIVDLSQVALPFQVASALGHAPSQRLMSRAEFVDRMRALRSCGHRDLAMLEALLAERPGAKREMQGDFELHLFDALKEAGLPLPVPQYRILRDDGTLAFVDFAYPDILLAIEADSYTWHASFERGRRITCATPS